jgi:hypothetical protein
VDQSRTPSRAHRVALGWGLALLLLAIPLAGGAGAAAGPAADSDGDGLPDDWEIHGVTLEGHRIDLPAMGADPLRPDIFLQIDWMADAEHDQRPRPEALALVVDAFARAPFVSPTGSVGIALHIDAGADSVLFRPHTRWGALSQARALPWVMNLGSAAGGSYDWSAFQAIKDGPGGFTESGRAAVFHYALFGYKHDLDDPRGSGASGNSRGIGGTDILVTLGNFTEGVGTVQQQAGTLMHELGHNLGLRHGGCDDTNPKPGYMSVMNYIYQMDGVVRGGRRGVVDFSRGVAPLLDAALLAEPPDLLASLAVEAAGRAPACTAIAEDRAGMAVRQVVSRAEGGTGPDRPASDCEDDWKNVRLQVGLLGHGP